MRVALFVLAAAAASAGPLFKKRQAVEPEVPETPVPSADPGPSPSPLEASAAIPNLAGADLAKLSLNRSVVRLTFDADTSGIAALDPRHEAVAVETLAVDPRWRVVERDGALVAFHRASIDDGYTVSLDGVHREDDVMWRVALCFGEWADGSWSALSARDRFTAGPTKSRFQLFPLGPGIHEGWTASGLAWEGPTVSLEVFEARDAEDRPRTVNALQYRPRAILALARALEEDVAPADRLPPGEPVVEPAGVELRPRVPGHLEMRARVNPGSAGWTWMRLVREDGTVWVEDAVGIGTRERVGYSDDPGEVFYMQAHFPAPSGDAFVAYVEFWHLADDADAIVLAHRFSDVVVPLR